MTDALRVVLADDSVLLREGLAGLLERQGHCIVAQESRADALRQTLRQLAKDEALPDLLITDVRMPPTMTNEGLVLAIELKAEYPDLAVMVLSQYVSPLYAQQLFIAKGEAGTGYLLKDRVAEVADFMRSLQLVAQGGVVVDPDVARSMITSTRSGLGSLTVREREVLQLMAQGKSNGDIAAELYISGAAVAKHVANIFAKLGLAATEENRRVRAILAYLSDAQPWLSA